MSALGVQVKPASLRSFLRACDRAEGDTEQMVTDVLGRAGEIVRAGAYARTVPKHARTAAGYVTRVEGRRVRVEQGLPASTGRHPAWGSWQMRHALLPSLRRNSKAISEEFRKGTDEVCKRFESAS